MTALCVAVELCVAVFGTSDSHSVRILFRKTRTWDVNNDRGACDGGEVRVLCEIGSRECLQRADGQIQRETIKGDLGIGDEEKMPW